MSRIKVGDRVRVNFYFDDQMFDAIKKLAEVHNTTYSELIRVAVREYVLREGQKAIDNGLIMKELKR